MRLNQLPDFEFFQHCFIPHSVKILKKDQQRIETAALDWFKKHFNPVFGSQSRCDTKGKITWHYSVGLLCFGFPKLSDYHYKFIIQMIHFEKWKNKEWQEGFMYGKWCSNSNMKITDKNYRDRNPYPETDFYRNTAWDAGYIMGLSKFSFKTIKIQP
jgi:hypothetical protein